jgi:CheY-like chemotaxis protein
MLSMLQTIVGENIELAWQPGAPEIIVKMDPSQLDQVIINLCVNARDAIAGSGKIIIKTQSRMISRNEKNAPVGLGPGRYLLLIIQDNGCGMDEVVLTHLFEPFFTTKAVGKGTGLGLATLYGIIHQNRGAISVSSEVGSGSTFEIYMPVSDEGSTQKRAEPLAKKPAVLAQGTILLVEDEPMLQTITTTILEKQGYVVLTTSSAKEALSRAADYSDSIDLMITDIVMPDMNGRELAKQITHNLPGIKVLYMSGYASNMVTPADTAEREFHFIQKPFSVAQLTEKVADILGAK